jgi:hypothetical protein
MAVGARITSENLSGKTATVTFTPYTGTTSGTTVNLGTKTIPFNNINSHPYGVYSLYLPEYDYTYTLTVDEPVLSSQLFVHSNRMRNSDNFGVATLNFNDFTAEVIDLGVDSTYWENDGLLPLTESGFGYLFRGIDNMDERLIVFTDASNAIVGQYSGATEEYSFSTLNGKWITFEDEDNGILKYFNGTDIYTYDWNPITHYINIDWDYEAVTGDDSFIVKEWELPPTGTGWTYNGDGVSIIMKSDGTTIPFKTWEDGTYIDHMVSPSTDFIVVETRLQGETSTYTNLQIYNTDGEILETVSLTGETYTSVEFEFLGTDKMCVVYWNSQDNSVDYKIIHYNHTTETLTLSSHVKGVNYPSVDVEGDDSFWPQDFVDGSVSIAFYKTVSSNEEYFSPVRSHYDIVYMLNGQSQFSTYVVTNGTQRAITTNPHIGNNIVFRIETTGNTLGLLSITNTGVTITDFNQSVSGVTSFNDTSIGNRMVSSFTTDDGLEWFFFLTDANGTILDSLNPTLDDSYGYNLNYQGDVAYLSYVTSDNVQHGYYVYSGSTGFTSTGYYNNTNTPNNFFVPTFIEPSVMLLRSSTNGTGRVLTNSGISSEFIVPEYFNAEFFIGLDKFMMVYNESNGGDIKIRLYDFTGTLLNSRTTNYSGWDDVYTAKDRFTVIFQDEGIKEFFLVSEDTITSVMMDDHDGETTQNDYVWWED